MSKKEQVEKILEAVKKPGRKPKTEQAKAAEAVAKKVITGIAESLPHGQGKEFLMVNKEMDHIESERKLLGERWRGCRARLKEMKIDLEPLDGVRKLRKKEPEDRKSYLASQALYMDQFGLDLSPHQQIIKKELEMQREAARDAMIDASGGSSAGKEIGSNTNGSNNIFNKPIVTVSSNVPMKNEQFIVPEPAAASTH